ncbi:MAG TPA: RecX family transcriptional regulator [Acetobacteraceae bacterium]|jgi:regulatory protein|nr:RecX family transcriptional regulator [Acetobacteraceae bacterium]
MAGSAPPPDEAALHQAALSHLARYATTSTGLEKVLFRRIARWARQTNGERAAIGAAVAAAQRAAKEVVRRLVAAGAVNDAAFAAARARRLARSGNSRQRIAAHLARHGITGDVLTAAMPADRAAELLAALMLARRRRMGPFRAGPSAKPDAARRELAAFARAGFPRVVADAVLSMSRAEAEEHIAAARLATE